jgi:hypothetical protein
MTAHRFQFSCGVELAEVEATLLLALWATEALHGKPSVRLKARHEMDHEQRTLTICSATDVGQNLNCILLGFLQREFRPEEFQIERISGNLTAREAPQLACR